MLVRALLVALSFACACAGAPAKKDTRTYCPESQRLCLQDARCEYDARRDCLVCACRTWDDAGPRGPGPAARAVPEGTPPTRLPPKEGGN